MWLEGTQLPQILPVARVPRILLKATWEKVQNTMRKPLKNVLMCNIISEKVGNGAN
jgi:hypothetical protein